MPWLHSALFHHFIKYTLFTMIVYIIKYFQIHLFMSYVWIFLIRQDTCWHLSFKHLLKKNHHTTPYKIVFSISECIQRCHWNMFIVLKMLWNLISQNDRRWVQSWRETLFLLLAITFRSCHNWLLLYIVPVTILCIQPETNCAMPVQGTKHNHVIGKLKNSEIFASS